MELAVGINGTRLSCLPRVRPAGGCGHVKVSRGSFCLVCVPVLVLTRAGSRCARTCSRCARLWCVCARFGLVLARGCFLFCAGRFTFGARCVGGGGLGFGAATSGSRGAFNSHLFGTRRLTGRLNAFPDCGPMAPGYSLNRYAALVRRMGAGGTGVTAIASRFSVTMRVRRDLFAGGASSLGGALSPASSFCHFIRRGQDET